MTPKGCSESILTISRGEGGRNDPSKPPANPSRTRGSVRWIVYLPVAYQKPNIYLAARGNARPTIRALHLQNKRTAKNVFPSHTLSLPKVIFSTFWLFCHYGESRFYTYSDFFVTTAKAAFTLTTLSTLILVSIQFYPIFLIPRGSFLRFTHPHPPIICPTDHLRCI